MESGGEGQRGWLRKLTSFFRRQPHQETSRKQDLGNEEQHGDSLQNEIPKHANMRRLCPHDSQNHGLAGPGQSSSKGQKNVQLQNTIAELPLGLPIHVLHGPHTSSIVPEFRNRGIASGANATQGYNTYQQSPAANNPPACAISENGQSDEMDVVEGVTQKKNDVEFRMDCSSTLFLTPSFDVQRSLMGVVTPQESQLGNQSVPNAQHDVRLELNDIGETARGLRMGVVMPAKSKLGNQSGSVSTVQPNKIREWWRKSNVTEENLNEDQMSANDDSEQVESDLEEDFPAEMHLLSSSLESLSMTPTPLSKTTSKPLKSILKATKPRRNIRFWDETVPNPRGEYNCSNCGIILNEPNLRNLSETCGHLFCGQCCSSNENNCLLCPSHETEPEENEALDNLASNQPASCPECGISYDTFEFRKVVDNCRHEKCRSCLMNSVNCRTCIGSKTEERRHEVPPATASSSMANCSGLILLKNVQLNSHTQILENNLNDRRHDGEDGSVDVEPRVEADTARLALEEYELLRTRATHNDDDLITNQNWHAILNSDSTGELLGNPVLPQFFNEVNERSVDAGNENNSQSIADNRSHDRRNSTSELENYSGETTPNHISTSNEAPQNNPVVEFFHTETAIETETTTVGDAALSGVLLPRNNKIFQNFDTQMEVDISETDGESVGNHAIEDLNSSDSDFNKKIVDRGSSSDNHVMDEHWQDSHEIETGPRCNEKNEKEVNSQQKPEVGKGNQRDDVNLAQTVIPTCSQIIAPEIVTEGHRREEIENSLDCHYEANVKEPHKIVTDECPYSCDQCGLDFSEKKALEMHSKAHKIYHCPNCSFSTLARYVLNLHIKTAHKQIESGDAVVTEQELSESTTSDSESEANSCKSLIEKSSTSSLQQLGGIESRNSDTEQETCESEEESDKVSPTSSRKSLQREKSATPTKKSNQKPDPPFTKGPFVCVICEKEFPRNNSLIRHIHRHTGEKPFSCKTCGKEFAFVYNLNCHLKTHSSWLKFKCKKCTARFRRQADLDRHFKDIHEKTENNEVPSTSVFVNKKENDQSDSDSELEGRKYPTIYHCEKCGHQFKLESRYIAHINKAHNKKQNQYKCRKCEKSFPKENGLERHMKVMHSKKKPCFCIECGKSFIWESGLKRHMKTTHSQERPFACEYANCSKTYKSDCELKEHRRTHTGERPFKCSECGKAFATQSSFGDHLKTHQGLSFACDICGDTFSQKRSIDRHKLAKHKNL